MKIRPEDFEMSPLAGYGLCFLALIMGGLGLEKFAAKEAQVKRGVIAAQTEFATLSAIGDTEHWASRLLESTEARQQLQSEIWQGNTSGVIAAEVQQALRGLAQSHGFDNIKVRVDPDPVDVDGIFVLNFEFSGRAPTPKTLADYFEGLATSPKMIIIDEARFTQTLRSPRPPVFTMSGLVPVQIAAAAAVNGDG